jgi:ABC-type oligopeptide transport system substrate-binding subunit
MDHFLSFPNNASFGRWSCLAAMLVLGGWLALSQAAPRQTGQKSPPLEEEDPNPKPLRKPPRVEELADLAHEVERATHPELQELYRRLAYPHDVVTKRNGVTLTVAPLMVFIESTTSNVAMKPYDDKWKLGDSITVRPSDIASVDYYEQIALTQVGRFLRGQLLPPGAEAAKSLTRRERLEGAEKALAAVLNFNKPTPDRYGRGSRSWQEWEQKLRAKLLDVRLESLHLLISANDWEEAFKRSDHLVHFEYKTDADVHRKIAKELAGLITKAVNERKYEEVHKRLLLLEDFPDSGQATEPISKGLRERADQKFRDAERAKERNDPVLANTLLNDAVRLWPRMSGLHEFRLQLNKEHPTLGVGVHELPEYFLPGTAVIDSEKQANELLYDSLVKLRDEPKDGQSYEPGVAVAMPRRTSQGYTFQLDRTAYWSAGKSMNAADEQLENRVTEADVRQTIRRLSTPGWPGFAPAWADLVSVSTGSQESDQVSLTLKQGFIDPLALMTFKILPASVAMTNPADPRFGKNPVGSGPYQLVNAQRRGADAEQASAVVFVANSGYHRLGKPDQPYIPEIRFFKSLDPVVDFKERRLHLLLDPSPDQIANLQKEQSGLTSEVKIQSLKNRRIYFLAVNHRSQALRNEAVRRAIAHAINRNLILDKVFRDGLPMGTEKPHRPLSGPFPPDSWAAEPSYPGDPYKPELVKQELAPKVKESLGDVKLTLKYPAGNPLVKRACVMIHDQVLETAGIDIELEECRPRDLHRDVEVLNQYDLAYYSFDYASEAYWIWPLFHQGSSDSRSRNYLGYQNDGALEEDCQKAMSHREFALVQEYQRSIYRQIYRKMPFIPLWQLDTFIAVHRDLKPVHIDPLTIFTDVEQWKLEKQ